jgi:hypothetical protein
LVLTYIGLMFIGLLVYMSLLNRSYIKRS